jgi:hypothetical protein
VGAHVAVVLVLDFGGTTTVVLVVTGGVVNGWSGVHTGVDDDEVVVDGLVTIVVVDGRAGRVVTLVITVGREVDVTVVTAGGVDVDDDADDALDVDDRVGDVLLPNAEDDELDGLTVPSPPLPASYAMASNTPMGILPRLRSCEYTPLSSW